MDRTQGPSQISERQKWSGRLEEEEKEKEGGRGKEEEDEGNLLKEKKEAKFRLIWPFGPLVLGYTCR